MRARTWRFVPRSRTKSTTAIPAPLERAWTIGIPFTTVFTSECVCPLTIKSTDAESRPRAQRVHRPVELVVSDRRGVDAERVHGRDRRQPEAEVREQGPLHLVAGVEADRGAAARP